VFDLAAEAAVGSAAALHAPHPQRGLPTHGHALVTEIMNIRGRGLRTGRSRLGASAGLNCFVPSIRLPRRW
jgi:hypothetical protein